MPEQAHMEHDDAGDRIAIIGMACRFPGAPDLEQLWAMLCAGHEAVERFTPEQLELAGVPASTHTHPSYVPVRGVLDDIEAFDAAFFGYAPAEAALIDPQQRVFLECAYEALEHAGCVPSRVSGSVGVFGGCGLNTYLIHNVGTHAGRDAGESYAKFVANDKDFLASRVAYLLGLEGPAVTVQTACSTSLVAVSLACQSLLAGACDVALAGGSTIVVPQRSGYLYEPGMILSPDGRCRAFDRAARGCVFGNGAGVVVLKRLADALADGDPIDAVVLASAVNNDGSRKLGFTAPSPRGQARAIATTHAIAGVPVETIEYVEAHGTATELGDPVELAGLTQAFRVATNAVGFCGIGSIKSNFGHLDTAAGVAGLIKAALAVREGRLPPSLHFREPNPELGLERSPFYVVDRLREWKPVGHPRRAGVSAFGLGGTNAHVLIEQPPSVPAAAPSPVPDARPAVLVLSARGESALRALAGRWAEFIDGPGRTHRIEDLCFSAATRRIAHEDRLAIVAEDHAQLGDRLRQFAAGRTAAGIVSDRAGRTPVTGKVALVCSGHGSQWVGMGQRLLSESPSARRALEDCDAALRPEWGRSLIALLSDRNLPAELERFEVVQPLLFALSIAQASFWRARGIEAGAVVGQSMGEVTAAYLCGGLCLDDAAKVIVRRSQILSTLAGSGRMLAVALGIDAAREAVAAHAGAAVAAGLSPRASVLSGPGERLEQLASELEARAIHSSFIKVQIPAHTAHTEPVLGALRAAFAGIRPRPTNVPMFSTVTAAPVAGEQLDAEYWVRNVRLPVRFGEAVAAMIDAGCVTFVELAPHPVLSSAVAETAQPRRAEVRSFASGRRDTDELMVLGESLGAMFCSGRELESCAAFGVGRQVRLPSYPWQRSRHWIEARDRAEPERAPPRGEPARETGGARTDAGSREIIEATWTDVLGIAPTHAAQSFFFAGGSSLLAVQLIQRINQRTGSAVSVAEFAREPTIAGLERLVGPGREGATRPLGAASVHPSLVPIQSAGTKLPFYCVTPLLGTAFPYYDLALELGEDQPFFALQPRALDGKGPPLRSIEAIAADYLEAIASQHGRAPVALGGWSFGGVVAYELARLRAERGCPTPAVVLLDVAAPVESQRPTLGQALGFFTGSVLPDLLPYLRTYLDLAAPRPRGGVRGWLRNRVAPKLAEPLHALARHDTGLSADVRAAAQVAVANAIAHVRYRPARYAGRLTLLRGQAPPTPGNADPSWGWSELSHQDVELHDVPGTHMTILRMPHVRELARTLADVLGRAAAATTPSSRRSATVRNHDQLHRAI